MGTVNWFLGTHFEWVEHDNGALSVLCRRKPSLRTWSNATAFTHPTSTLPALPTGPASLLIPSLPPKSTTLILPSCVVVSPTSPSSAVSTGLPPILDRISLFLAAYNHCPSKGHMDAALHVVRYLRSTTSHGIAFHSSAPATSEAYVHYPFPHDAEAYHDCTPLPATTSLTCSRSTPTLTSAANSVTRCPTDPKSKCSSSGP